MSRATSAPSRQNTTFPSGSGQAHGYLALPPSGSGPGVIVIQEWWGLTDHIADVADRLAAEGFVALAPDLYGGRVAHDADEAGALMMSLPIDRSAAELGGAVDFLLGHEAVTGAKVGAVGFCMGGGFVLLLAAQQGDKVGRRRAVLRRRPGRAAGLHRPAGGRAGPLRGARRGVPGGAGPGAGGADPAGVRRLGEFHYYDAGHAFHNDTNKLGTYSREDAETAWSRTVAFLREQLA